MPSGQKDDDGVLYTVEDTPPWYLCVLLGFQHYLTAVGAMISVPLVLSEHFCMDKDYVGISQLIGTLFFVSGLCTLLQTTFGVRLPIVQGGQFTFVVPTIAIMAQRHCPYRDARNDGIPESNFTELGIPAIGSEDHRDIWMSNIREIQGAFMVASLFQVVIGFSGLMGLVLRFIGPLAITPTVSLVGLSLFNAGSNLASKQWWIAIMTVVLIALFSQYLRKVTVPCISIGDGKLPLLKLFPVLLAMLLSWAICAILTEVGALPEDPKQWGYSARTDKSDVLTDAAWIRFPYPGQWGVPTVTAASVFGILPGVFASMVESVGDYYACARLSGAPPPPVHAINRGIGMEGIGCILAGAWGSGNGTTSYSENVGAIGITKVGSRRVVQVGGVIMLILGCLGKFGALFTTIPDPVVGGMFIVAFGMVTAVGISNLQFVDLNSPRNLFILGVSMYFGLCLPLWLQANNEVIDTGSALADQILTVLFSTSMFVGGLVGLVLDNTIPGTDEERGIHVWRNIDQSRTTTQSVNIDQSRTTTQSVNIDQSRTTTQSVNIDQSTPRTTTQSVNIDQSTSRTTTQSVNIDQFTPRSVTESTVYDLPFQRWFNKVNMFRFVPFCPAFLRSTVDSAVVNGTKENSEYNNSAYNVDCCEINTQL